MPEHAVIYLVVHQPRRPLLPAAPLPARASAQELSAAIFDETLNRRYFRKVARWCYHPAVDDFLGHLDRGLKINIAFSSSFLRQAEAWDPELLDKLRRLVSRPNLEVIGVEPYHSFLFWLNLEHFRRRMAWMREALTDLFGKPVQVTDTTEMILSPEIYAAVESLGFRGVFAEGRQLLEWREPTHTYVQTDHHLRILPRHNRLSDDVGYRFSNKDWEGYPLKASDYARWIRDTGGEFAVLGWDFETFGEHHRLDSGIFEFLRWLPGELDHHGVTTLTASEALDRYGGHVHSIDIPASPTTWAGRGDMSCFLGNSVQQDLFHLMRHAYNLAVLSGDPELLDIALWLSQSDNLHLLQWYEEFSAEAEVSAYFTADEWWHLGHVRLLAEMRRVYQRFIDMLSQRLAREGGSPLPIVGADTESPPASAATAG
ncbi:MAG: glycoside hydrolase [Armatimonadetes bacterium]|nr:glycoside hydrolase [Gemmatimonadales bacterium]NIO75901.1 glycoside hydrolase [Armatimonadota bacterium]